MNRHYFTFGTSRKFPSKYPGVNEGVVNCSDDQFSKTGMVDGNLGAGYHDILLCQEV